MIKTYYTHNPDGWELVETVQSYCEKERGESQEILKHKAPVWDYFLYITYTLDKKDTVQDLVEALEKDDKKVRDYCSCNDYFHEYQLDLLGRYSNLIEEVIEENGGHLVNGSSGATTCEVIYKGTKAMIEKDLETLKELVIECFSDKMYCSLLEVYSYCHMMRQRNIA